MLSIKTDSFKINFLMILAMLLLAASVANAGDITLHSSGRYLQDASGRPMFLIGYYGWAAVPDGYFIDHPSRYSKMITSGAPYKINYIRISLGVNRMTDSTKPKSENGVPTPVPFLYVNGKADLNQWDPVLWNGLKAQCQLAKDNGVIVHISIFDGVDIRGGNISFRYANSFWKPSNQSKKFYTDPDSNGNGYIDDNGEFYQVSAFNKNTGIGNYQRKLIDKVIAETSAFDNVFYEIGNELLSSSSEWNAAVVKYVKTKTKKAITQNGGVKAAKLIGWAQHEANTPAEVKSKVASIVGAGYSAWEDPDGPSLISGSSDDLRSAAWYSFTGGAGGWGGFTSDFWSKGSGFDTTKATYYKNLMDFIYVSGIQFWKMTPQHNLVSNSGTNSCLASRGSQYVAYILSDDSATLDLSDVSGNIGYQLYDPRTGTYSGIQSVAGGSKSTFTKPAGASDWVICVSNAARQWSPVDFTLDNPTYTGNPFDLIASATFVHKGTDETRTTGMFYTGGTTWKFRFTGTRPGIWTYTTSSTDSDLNELSGTVTVEPAADDKYGFVWNQGNQWVRPRGQEGTLTAFVPQYVMYANPAAFYNNPSKIDADIQTFFVGHGYNGFHTGLSCRWFDINQDSYDGIPSNDPNPDFRSFEALELLINKVNAAGGVVHIWAWGDESRHATPVKWGINGNVDKRLQRYIAARLGPLPNWTLGYGFDLWEWTKEPWLREWHDYLHSQFGWPHMLGTRNFQKDLWVQLSEALDYSSYEHWRPDYNMYVQTMEDRPTKPSFSEDRFRVRNPSPYPDKDYTEEMVRRGLWHSTMAGGVANIWGYLVKSPADGTSAPFPNPQWSRTCATFFQNRFLLGMVRDNAITNGVCLRTPDSKLLVFYKEDTNSITMNLSSMPLGQTAVAVDTKLPYQEIKIGMLKLEQHNWTAPHTSDWAIAVGASNLPGRNK